MRKHLLLLLCLLLSQLATAGIVSQEEARQKALAFMSQRNAGIHQKGMRLAAKGSQLTPAAADALYYVFNAGQADGFVIVSGDDRTPAILGYATSGSYDEADMPENMRAWMAEYDRQLRFLASHPNAGVAKVTLDEHKAIAPLLKTTWGQDEPYNNLCPMDPVTGERSITGCVATAMAQIVAYYRYPDQTTDEIPAYTSNGVNGKIEMPAVPVTDIDWDNIIDSYRTTTTADQNNAVATLMKLCGSALQMGYSSNVSGAFSQRVSYALKHYFDYDAAVTNVRRDLYTANDWNNLIYDEIANKRPVCYCGESMGGGHEFVIDGYDKEGLFHVNWGWNGDYNNYFLLSILDPHNNSGAGASTSTDGYSFNQDANINIQPNTGIPFEESPIRMTTTAMSPATTTTFAYDSEVEGYEIEFIGGFMNFTGETQTFDLALAAFDKNGKWVDSYLLFRDQTLDDAWGCLPMRSDDVIVVLPDGEYTIFFMSKLSSETNWLPNFGSEKYHLKATVSNNVLTLSGAISLNATDITATGNLEAGGMVSVGATIANNGDSFFNDLIYLMVDGEKISAKYFEAEPGESDQFEIVYKPTTTGTKTLSIGYMLGKNFVSIGSKSITISEPKSYSLAFSNAKVTNATNYTINADYADIQLTVTNNSTTDYNDCIKTIAFKRVSGNYWSYFNYFDTPVNIAANATETVNIKASGLVDGAYWFVIVYKTDGAFKNPSDQDAFDELYNYTVVVPDPEQEPELKGDGTLENPYSVADAAIVASQLAAGEATAESFYVKGKISAITQKFTHAAGTATFNLSDDGTTSGKQFTANTVRFLENKLWLYGNTQIKVGNDAVVYAPIVNAATPSTPGDEGYLYSLNGVTFEDTPTGISSLTPSPIPAYAPTRSLSPIGEGSIYTLSGQRVKKPVKGLYIVNGKKVVVR